MRVLVLSDTHAGSLPELPEAVLTAAAGADLIVHAGDFTETGVLQGLRSLKELRAVRGNMDSLRVRMSLPRQDVFTAAGKRIGVIHGWGPPEGIAGRVRAAFDDVDVVIFGHSHRPCRERLRGALMFNPGRGRESYGLLTIAGDITAEIVPL